MSKRKIALVLVVAMLTLIMIPGMTAGAATPPAGWNNLQPIEIFGNRTWNEGWAGSSGGLEVTSSNIANADAVNEDGTGPYVPRRMQFRETGIQNLFGRALRSEMNRQDTGRLQAPFRSSRPSANCC